MKPIRLAYLVSRYPAISHTFILREVRTLRQNGFEIAVASINAPDRQMQDMTAAEQEEMQNTFYVKPSGLWGALQATVTTLVTRPIPFFRGLGFALSLGKGDIKKWLYGVFYFIEALMIGQWMQKHRLSHIHVHFATPAATVGMILSRTFPMTYSMTVHGPDEFYNVKDYYLTQKIAHADFICCISNFARSQLMLLSPATEWDKFDISPLGVNPSIFQPAPFREHPEPFEIVCVGRLVPVKGQHILLQAVAKLLEKGRQVRLRYVGDGPDRESLEQQAKTLGKAVRFAGAVNQDRILDFYKRADAFVLATFAEGVPVVLMEAMMMQIPCVTTHITGIPELIRQGEGLLVAPSDIEGLTAAIESLMDNPQLRQDIGHKARASVLERYELETNTLRLGEIFRKRLGHK
ncbi:glycosyltransferase [Candidatus Albibeggiatoa sp. nov. NOAA]|uniref:glycosyltransferase n=1 Tax=Candidatus Albibeggiatoa sp. nov. NOAA TaxID=3162724 RepID=UPI0033006DA1|nr:glycosyltransferase family 4 protein [Thiotrichaceae bacterium]